MKRKTKDKTNLVQEIVVMVMLVVVKQLQQQQHQVNLIRVMLVVD